MQAEDAMAPRGRAPGPHEREPELSTADLELLGRICDELRGEEARQGKAQDRDDPMDGARGRGAERQDEPMDGGATADELRREKNRQKVRRHYHRRLRMMSDLRRQVGLLETQLRHLQQHQAQCPQHQPLLMDDRRASTAPPAAAMDTVGWQARMEVLAELERVRAQLERENRALRHCVAFRDACQPRTVQSPPDDEMRVLRPPSFLVVRPVDPREVQDLRGQMRAQVADFAHGRSFSRLGSVRGWEAERAVDAGLFKFLLRRRRIRGASPEALLRDTWALLTDDRRFRSLFSSRLGVACNVVQPIDGDNALALLQYSGRRVSSRSASGLVKEQEDEVMQDKDARTVKTLYALAKFSEPQDAHTIVLRGIERRPLVLQSVSTLERSHDITGDDEKVEEEEWSDLFAWLRFERTEEGSALTFGGGVPTLDARSPFWLVELFLVALRWEKAVLG